jgi:hypothetical protein
MSIAVCNNNPYSIGEYTWVFSNIISLSTYTMR